MALAGDSQKQSFIHNRFLTISRQFSPCLRKVWNLGEALSSRNIGGFAVLIIYGRGLVPISDRIRK